MGVRIYHYPVIDSTNVEAGRLLREENLADPIVVSADFQEYGKGQRGRSWESDKGDNLLMSWVVFPAFLSVEKQFLLSEVVTLAISDLLNSCGISSEIKWPNDIISNEEKIAGILIEHSLSGPTIHHTIAGIGLNINQEKFPEFSLGATSMRKLTGNKYDIPVVRDRLIELLEKRFVQLKDGNEDLLHNTFHKNLYRLNQLTLFQKDNVQIRAVVAGVKKTGELIVEIDGKVQDYGYHEIRIVT